MVLSISLCLVAGSGARADTRITARDEPAVEPLPAPASSGSSITIPYYEVDLNAPGGKTLLFAIHNPGSLDAEVTVNYFGTDDTFGGSQVFTLGGRAVRTINLRDVDSFLPPADPDGFVRGQISIEAGDPFNPGVDRLITVDYFSVTPNEDFATGQRASPFHEMVSGPLSPFKCDVWSIRFLNGGPFSGGTQVVLWIDRPQTPPMPSLHVDVYDESGTFHGGADIATDQNTDEVPIGEILSAAGVSGVQFGVLLIDFADATDGGYVSATYDAEGEFSIGLRGGCLFE